MSRAKPMIHGDRVNIYLRDREIPTMRQLRRIRRKVLRAKARQKKQ